MKNILYILMLLIASTPAFAQKEKKVDPKHANHFKVAKVETDDYIVEVTDIFVRMEEAKCKVKITNKTNDYLVWNPSESVFKFEFGEFKPKEKEVIIKPNDKESKVLNVTGDTRFHVEALTLEIKGMSKVAATGTMVMAPDFQLPASMNDFTVPKGFQPAFLPSSNNCSQILKWILKSTAFGFCEFALKTSTINAINKCFNLFLTPVLFFV